MGDYKIKLRLDNWRLFMGPAPWIYTYDIWSIFCVVRIDALANFPITKIAKTNGCRQ